MAVPGAAAGPLQGVRILDLSRVLAGPSATQVLGDLGADVVKVERPEEGDDTRRWGPPFVRDRAGVDTSESAYYLSANRNKRSITLDFSQPRGQELVRRLMGRADVVIENYKVGTLARYGLGYDQLKAEFPQLVYCSITGFGQTGPYATRAGYDFLIQGMGGIMSLTGEPDGPPERIGVGIADLMTGLYAVVAILAALRHRDAGGGGQHIDLALLDTQVAWLSYAAQSWLSGGAVPERMGNAHPSIVPYQAFATADGHVILGIGNDGQFAKFCRFAGRPDLAEDPHFRTNLARVRHRDQLVPVVAALMAERTSAEWITGLGRLQVPCSPINRVDQVFADPQVQARGLTVDLPHPLSADPVRLLASPLRFSETPVSYRRAPPTLGQHTSEVFGEWLGLGEADLADLRADGVI